MTENVYIPDYRRVQRWRLFAPDKTPANILTKIFRLRRASRHVHGSGLPADRVSFF